MDKSRLTITGTLQIYGIFALRFTYHAKAEQMKTMYEKVGDERLQLIVKRFYDQVFENEIIGPLFAQSDKAVVMDKQFCFLTQFLGGPLRYFEKYGNPKMRMRHLPHKIDERAKDEWLRLMKNAIFSIDWDEENKTTLYNCFPTLAAHMMNS